MTINYRYLTGHFTTGRGGKIPNQITLHTSVSNADSLYDFFQGGSRNSSSTAYVNKTGVIEQYVRDEDTSWCNANFPSNQRSLTVETWDGGNPYDPIRTPEMYESLAQLCAMWMKKYPIAGVLLSKEGALAGKSGFTLHKYFTSTSCPAGLNVQRVIDRALIINGGQPMDFDYGLYIKDNNLYMKVLVGSINEKITIKNEGTGWVGTPFCNKSVGNDGNYINENMTPNLYTVTAKGVVHQYDNRPVVDPCANVKAELEATKVALADSQAQVTTLTTENTALKAEVASFVPETIYRKR